MKTFVIVFYLLTPSWFASPQWVRLEFSYITFSDEKLCKRFLNDTRVAPPTNVASIVLCEEKRQ